MRYLKTNTATIVTVGPFLDKTDGVTLETALTITNERISFTVDLNDGSAPTLVLDNVTGATSGTSNDLNYITNNDAGLMQLELAAANVNYLGRAFLTITDAANHCPVFHEFMILPAVIFDAMIAGTDLFDVSMTQILGTAVSTPATAGILDINLKNIANAVVSTSTAQLGVNAVQIGAAVPGSATVGTVTNLTNAPTAGDLTATMKTSVTTAATAATPALSAGGVTAVQSGLATAANLATLTGYVDTEVAVILAAVDTEVAAIKTKTDFLPSATAGAAGGVFIAGANAATSVTTALTANITGNLSGAVGSVTAPVTAGTVSDKTGYALSSAGVQAIWDALTSALTTAGSVGKRIADYLDAAISSRGTSTYAGGDTSGTTTLLSRIVGTLATGTHNPQTGDTYARIGAAGAGLTALGDTRLANLDATVSSRNATTPPTVSAIADQVWDEPMSGHATPSTAGAILIDIIEDTSTTIPLAIAGIGTIPATSAIADAVWDEALSGHATSGTAGKKLTDLANADLSGVATSAALATVAGYIDTEVASILAAVDTEVAAIKAKTDNLPASPAAVGSAMTLTAAYDAAKTAATQASVDDLPTNAELATSQAAADDATLAAIAALNNLSSAQAQTAATAALNAYDPPTNTEMEARTLVAAGYATAAALTAVDDFVDTEVAAIKAVIDKIDTALVLDGAVYQLTANALELAPTGSGSVLDAAGIRAAVGLASANLDTQLADVPTVAEFNDRTLPAASYFDPATDTVARVTLTDTATTLTNMPVAAPSAVDIKTMLEADGSKLDHLWEMTEDDSGTRRFTTNALEQAPSGSSLNAQETADAVNNLAPSGSGATGSIRDKLDAIGTGLEEVGLIPLVYTLTEPDGITPIAGVTVELYTEQACVNCVRRGVTNTFGAITFWMTTAGTYWIRSTKDGYQFDLDSEIVTV